MEQFLTSIASRNLDNRNIVENEEIIYKNDSNSNSDQVYSSHEIISSIKVPISMPNQNTAVLSKNQPSLNNFSNLILNKDYRKSRIKISSNFLGSKAKKIDLDLVNVEEGDLLPKKKTFYDVISNFYTVKKFITILMSFATVRKPKFLNKTHFKLIDDKSIVEKTFKDNSKSNYQGKSVNVTKFKKYLFSKIKILPPFHFLLFTINTISIICYCFFLFIVPVSICFKIEISENFGMSHDFYHRIMIFICVIHVFEILLNFIKAFYSKGELIIDRDMIALFYLKNDFLIDFIAFFCLLFTIVEITNFYENNTNIILLCIFLIIKFKKIINIIKQMEELFIVDQTYFNIYELLKLFTRIIIIAHFAACIWFSIAFAETSKNKWTEHIKIENLDWSIKYLYSFYFIMITMNTVGYGDIAPQNPKEIIFCICFVFIACSLFAYCINCVGNIFKEIYQRESGFRADLFSINEFMRNKKVNKTLQMRIRKYLEYIWKEEKIQNIEFSKTVIKKLSSSLRSNLMLEANGPLIADVDLFTKNFSEKTLRAVIDIMTEERYTPGEIIFEKGSIDNFDMFIIKHGNVEIFVENNLNEEKKVLINLGEGKTFGQISFFSELERTTSVKSTDFTILVRINQNKFKKIILENILDYERFNHIKDSIKFYNRFDLIFMKCYSCNSNNHLITDCPLLHRKFYKEGIICRYNNSFFQERGNKIRLNKVKIKALNLVKMNKMIDFQFLNTNEEITENLVAENTNSLESLEEDKERKKSIISHSKTIKIDSFCNFNQIEEITNSDALLETPIHPIIHPKEIDNTKTNDSNISLTLKCTKTNSKNVNLCNDELSTNSISIEKENKKSYNESNNFIENKHEMFRTSKTIKTMKEDKDSKNELVIDSLKIFQKYFLHNNADKVIEAINKKKILLLKKRRKGHLFGSDKLSNLNSPMNKLLVANSPTHSNFSPLEKSKFKLDGVCKSNILRKKSEVLHDWKEELEMFRIKGKKNRKNCKSRVISFFTELFKYI